MLRVANVLTAGRFGGPQHRVLQVATRLREHDIETTVILPRLDSAEFQHKLDEAGVPSIALPLHRLTRQRSHLLAYGALFGVELAGLVAALRRTRAELVHCNGVWALKPVLGGRLAFARVALHLNDTFTTPVMRALHRVTAPRCHGYIFAAERAKQAYPQHLGRPGAPTATIPAPVDTARFAPDQVDPDAAIADRGPVRVLTAGTLNPAKGLEHFAEMAVRVARRRPDVTFHVVGAELDSQRAYLADVKRRAASLPDGALTFHGPSSSMPASYAAAQIYVCSSIAEASPMAVWEAMSMERAVVSTDVGDVALHLDDGRSGFIVPPGDPDALAERVVQLVDDTRLRRRLGAAAREAVCRDLDVSACVERHRRFYETLAAS